MRTIDLDELWNALPQTSGKTALRAVDTVRASRHDRPDMQGHLAVDARFDGAERSAPSMSINDLAALRMPDVDFKPEAAPFGLRDRLLRFDGFLKSFDTAAAVWLSMGFISGMIAWHSIGFWGFVTEAVLHPGDRDYKIAVTAQPPILDQPHAHALPLPLTTGSLPDKKPSVDVTDCVALAVGRFSSQTHAEACSGDGAQLRYAGRGQRGDRLANAHERLQAPQAWTAEAETASDSLAVSAGAAVMPDFDLTLKSE